MDAAAATRASGVLLGALILLVLLPVAAAFDRGMDWWGLDGLRFAAPWFGWGLAALLPVAFVPPIARFLEARLAPFGDALARPAFGAGLLFAASATVLVLVFPDRLWLMGDFLMRLGCTRGQIPTQLVFPQALPLDLLLHHEIPVALAHAGLPDPNLWERGLGAAEVLALGFAAVAFARRLGLRGAILVAVAGIVLFSGTLVMFTGYGKGFVELTLATVATAVFALRVVQEGRGVMALALTVSTALLLHRSALALLAPLAVSFVLWWRGPAARDPARRTRTAFVFALPLAVGAVALPPIVAAMKVIDVRHLAPSGSSPGAILGAAFAPAHLRDVLDLILQLAPVVLTAPLLAIFIGPALRERSREAAVIGAMVVPALLVLLFVHPRQGPFRDVDVFVPSLAALTLAAAALAGETLRGAGRRAWLTVPLLAFTLVTTVTRLSIAADVERGMTRVRAYLEGPPRRSDDQRGLLWAWVAERYANADDPDRAVDAYLRSAELTPSPRILTELAMVQMDRHDYRGAQDAYGRAVVRTPGYTEGWLGLAYASIAARDWRAADHALQQAAVLEPGRPEIAAMRRAMERARAAAAARRDSSAGPPR